MVNYDIAWINEQAANDPAGFIARSEAHYQAQISNVAEHLAVRHKTCPIVLLCGPSSSGKTTTADRLRRALNAHSIYVHTISMDDYYLSRDSYELPWDDENEVYDFESPMCMDLPLLHDHLERLAKGKQITIPTFDFAQKSRTEEYKKLKLGMDEMVIIEGIHAFNDVIMGGLEQFSTGIYISVASDVQMDEWVLTPDQLRFCRRAVRDAKFRGAPVEATIQQWKSIRRGERLYINPFRASASHVIDSYLPYETCILMNRLNGNMKNHLTEMEQAGLRGVIEAAGSFVPIDYLPHIPDSSVLHEFIG